MGTQSHKQGGLRWCKSEGKKESVDSKLARGCDSKLLLKVAIDLGLNLIIKTSILL